MKKTVVLLFLILSLVANGAAALDAVINPSDPADIVLDSSNSWGVSKTYDGSASSGDGITYSWNLVDDSASDSGPEAEFTFDRDSSSSNTVRLTISNGTHSDVAEVTQVVRDVPDVSVSASGSTSITEGDSLSFTASVTDSFDSSLTYDWDWGDGESCNDCSKSESHTFSSSGTYTVKISVTDGAGYTGHDTVTVDVSSSDDDGGGGGSSGGFAYNSFALDLKEKTFNQINPGARVSMNILEPGKYGVRSISIFVRNPANDVTLQVRKQEGKPAQVTQDVSGNPYRYLNISATNINDSSIDKATINFDVNRSWIVENDINTSRVYLSRYDGSEWDRLETGMVGEQPDTIAYEADTPGFSYFAVEGDQNQEPSEDDTGTGTDDNQTDDTSGETGDEGTDGTGDNDTVAEPPGGDGTTGARGPSTALIVGLLVMLALVAGGVFYYVRFYGSGGLDDRGVEEPEQDLEAFASMLRDELEDSDLEKKDALLESIENAETLLEDGEYDRALDILDMVQSRLEDNGN